MEPVTLGKEVLDLILPEVEDIRAARCRGWEGSEVPSRVSTTKLNCNGIIPVCVVFVENGLDLDSRRENPLCKWQWLVPDLAESIQLHMLG